MHQKAILLILCSLLFARGVVLAEDILPPEQVFHFHVERALDTQYLRIDIKAGYYLYANKLKLEAQAPLTWERPQGTFKEDPYFGRVEIYQGNVIVPFPPTLQNLPSPIKAARHMASAILPKNHHGAHPLR